MFSRICKVCCRLSRPIGSVQCQKVEAVGSNCWKNHSHSQHCYYATKPPGAESPSFRTSLDTEEAQKFVQFSETWWDHEKGEAAALHTLNKLRVPFIRDGLLQTRQTQRSPQPLKGFKLLDVGCGGGVLAEAIARLGATVQGIDAVPENISMAERHTGLDPSLKDKLSYQYSLVEDLVDSERETFDGVVSSEVLEHVADIEHFVSSCCQLVKPGGSIFFTTINKTRLSYMLAVLAAEYVFKVVPQGTHDWDKFVPIEDLKSILRQNDFDVRLIHGMTLNPVNLRWRWMDRTDVNYALHAVKQVA